MKKEEVHARIEEVGIVPAVRTSSAENAQFAAEAVSRGGIPIVEITMTVPGAIDVISSLVKILSGHARGCRKRTGCRDGSPLPGRGCAVPHNRRPGVGSCGICCETARGHISRHY